MCLLVLMRLKSCQEKITKDPSRLWSCRQVLHFDLAAFWWGTSPRQIKPFIDCSLLSDEYMHDSICWEVYVFIHEEGLKRISEFKSLRFGKFKFAYTEKKVGWFDYWSLRGFLWSPCLEWMLRRLTVYRNISHTDQGSFSYFISRMVCVVSESLLNLSELASLLIQCEALIGHLSWSMLTAQQLIRAWVHLRRGWVRREVFCDVIRAKDDLFWQVYS